MRMPPMIEPREVRVVVLLLALLVAIAAAINVPWAVTMIRSREQENKLPQIVHLSTDRGDRVPSVYPSRIPHPKPWPAPNYWSEDGTFGCRIIDARYDAPDRNGNRGHFTMQVQWVGWPLPVIEIKQMWWDWDDPALKGPEPDPRPSLMLGGLVLNPLILGGSAWLAFVLPWLAFTLIRRTSRWRNQRCMKCGYPIGTSANCTECGACIPSPSGRGLG